MILPTELHLSSVIQLVVFLLHSWFYSLTTIKLFRQCQFTLAQKLVLNAGISNHTSWEDWEFHFCLKREIAHLVRTKVKPRHGHSVFGDWVEINMNMLLSQMQMKFDFPCQKIQLYTNRFTGSPCSQTHTNKVWITSLCLCGLASFPGAWEWGCVQISIPRLSH